MAGRIRTIKPEWLEDEKMVLASPYARVLSIALILEADDYGNGRANTLLMNARIFPGHSQESSGALQELHDMGFLGLYQVRGQEYFTIHNWGKHQKVSKPGKPRVPPPSDADGAPPEIPPGNFGNPRPDHDHIPTTNDLDPDPDPERAGRAEDGVLQKAGDVLMSLNEQTGANFPITSSAMLKDIARRLRGEEGEPSANVAELELVIAHRVAKWSGTEQAEFLRPQTLFAKKYFTGYLAAARIWDEQGRPERVAESSGHRRPSDINNAPVHPAEMSLEELEQYREKGECPF